MSSLARSWRQGRGFDPLRRHEEQADQCGAQPVLIARRRPTPLKDQEGIEVCSGHSPEHRQRVGMRQPWLESAAALQKGRDMSLLAESHFLVLVIARQQLGITGLAHEADKICAGFVDPP